MSGVDIDFTEAFEVNFWMYTDDLEKCPTDPYVRQRCLCVTCCPCVVFGKIAAAVNSDLQTPVAPLRPYNVGLEWINFWMHGCFGGALMCAAGAMGPGPLGAFFSFGPCLALFMRGRIREKYDIDGSVYKDCFVHYLTWPCALTQEYEELSLRNPAPTGYKWKVLKALDDE